MLWSISNHLLNVKWFGLEAITETKAKAGFKNMYSRFLDIIVYAVSIYVLSMRIYVTYWRNELLEQLIYFCISVSGEDLNLYRILEDLKDGQATTSKYDNDNIRFKTPNTVMVFSNYYPVLKKLSKDRWILLHPNKDGLKDVIDLYKKNSKEAKERAKENFNIVHNRSFMY